MKFTPNQVRAIDLTVRVCAVDSISQMEEDPAFADCSTSLAIVDGYEVEVTIRPAHLPQATPLVAAPKPLVLA